jgi:hypothetical protein
MSLFPFFFLPLLQRQLPTISREKAPVQGVKEKSHFAPSAITTATCFGASAFISSELAVSSAAHGTRIPDLDIICPLNETRASKHQVVRSSILWGTRIYGIAVSLSGWRLANNCMRRNTPGDTHRTPFKHIRMKIKLHGRVTYGSVIECWTVRSFPQNSKYLEVEH